MEGDLPKNTILALLVLTILVSLSSTFIVLNMLEQSPPGPQSGSTGTQTAFTNSRISLNVGPNTPQLPKQSQATGRLTLSIKGG